MATYLNETGLARVWNKVVLKIHDIVTDSVSAGELALNNTNVFDSTYNNCTVVKGKLLFSAGANNEGATGAGVVHLSIQFNLKSNLEANQIVILGKIKADGQIPYPGNTEMYPGNTNVEAFGGGRYVLAWMGSDGVITIRNISGQTLTPSTHIYVSMCYFAPLAMYSF